MKKRTTQVIVILGFAMAVLPIIGIYQLFLIAREINSQPNPPPEIILHNIPYIGNLGIGEVWNLLAVLMSIGLVLTVGGIAKYNLVTRYA